MKAGSNNHRYWSTTHRPSVGCFVTHGGSGSLGEGMISKCQLVLLPHKGDQFINARMLSSERKVGVLVERMEDGGFSRDADCKADNVCL
ncbi:hypothetical protein MLD38_039909 [Melastoma candidum]|uniref:Uncharacterized protein n=1 Tax=Melastoma candidum TaxID=119954 RepID=A0ACB9L4D4_9MYRT|nr:hypothetical protein MLD38_039909 [Melastoma candidum]